MAGDYKDSSTTRNLMEGFLLRGLLRTSSAALEESNWLSKAVLTLWKILVKPVFMRVKRNLPFVVARAFTILTSQ
jgi:hypothetical protein